VTWQDNAQYLPPSWLGATAIHARSGIRVLVISWEDETHEAVWVFDSGLPNVEAVGDIHLDLDHGPTRREAWRLLASALGCPPQWLAEGLLATRLTDCQWLLAAGWMERSDADDGIPMLRPGWQRLIDASVPDERDELLVLSHACRRFIEGGGTWD